MLAVVMAALLLAAASCSDFSLYGVMRGEIPGGIPQISPLAVTLVVGATCDFSASGGSPPHRFLVLTGSGSIDAGSGLYTAPPTPGNSQIQVSDSKGATSSPASVTIVY